MSTYKNTSGDLTLTGDNGLATLTINYANTVFTGNLTYTGNLTTVDDFIVVAANNTGTVTDMGLLAQTGPSTFAGLRFDVAANTWQISPSVTSGGLPIASYANIFTGSGSAFVAGANTQIQFNDGGNFGATANLSFNKSLNQLFLSGFQAFANTAIPANVANAVSVYSNAVSAGGTGIYFTSAGSSGELISKSKAIAYSLIL
jgi:hypothetical protein